MTKPIWGRTLWCGIRDWIAASPQSQTSNWLAVDIPVGLREF
jgi:hypothetical protein